MKKLLLGLLIVSQFDAVLANSENWRNRTKTCHNCNGAGTVTYPARHNSAIVDLFGSCPLNCHYNRIVHPKAPHFNIAPTSGIESWTISVVSDVVINLYEDSPITVAQLRDYFQKGNYNPDFITFPNHPCTIIFKDQNGNYYQTETSADELDAFLKKWMVRENSHQIVNPKEREVNRTIIKFVKKVPYFIPAAIFGALIGVTFGVLDCAPNFR